MLYVGAIAFWLAMLAGWIMNIFNLCALAAAQEPLTTKFVLMIVGVVVAPLGGVLGYVF